ncbi:MAG: DEAD/DEAH box helicase [Acidobacteriia bacterium]|nr:DEAD/DEAH box helicase [Terriglobia bacterium]
MGLSARLAGYFSRTVRTRGQEYHWSRRVRIQEGSDSRVMAWVTGSNEYAVSLELGEKSALVCWCDCAYFDTEGPCKHLWATILAAEARGYLAPAASASGLRLDENGSDPTEGSAGRIEYLPKSGTVIVHPKPVPKAPDWRAQVAEIAHRRAWNESTDAAWPAKRQIVYIVDVPQSRVKGCLVLLLQMRDRRMDGSWSRHTSISLKQSQIRLLPLREDREILSVISGGAKHYYDYLDERLPESYLIKHPLSAMLMPLIAGTGRCYLRTETALTLENSEPLRWDAEEPWRLGLKMSSRDQQSWAVTGYLQRKEHRMELSAVALLTSGGLVFSNNCVAALAEDTPSEWLWYLQKSGSIEAATKDQDDFLAALLSSPDAPALEVPEDLRYEEVTPQPRPHLMVRSADPASGRQGRLRAKLLFGYEGRVVSAQESSRGWYEAANRRFLRRDVEVEKAAAALLSELGLKFQGPIFRDPEPAWEMAPSKFPRVVRVLMEAGWHVEAEGKAFRRPGAFRVEVSSGVDWFELHGEVEYGETRAKLPELLAALRRGDAMVQLSDGNYGMLPEEWLRRFGPLAGLGTPADDHLRFRPSQAGLLDALLATQPEARCDETFARVRAELGLFQGVQPADQPAGFVGHLRDYQREGLGWMYFLRRFSFGGCLADDMGVGKTAQVLALLEDRRQLRTGNKSEPPSLVVVPKSLVFNWKLEAARFTPRLRVLDYTGLARSGNDFSDFDVVLTTYGTLRRDALQLKDVEFDYIILDEAQAIKNASTESAKAVRLLRGRHRLALSGTPMENHLGELWTLFEFLNPGMLGAASAFKLAGESGRNPDEDTRRLLAAALRPFILRRTKEQVARELPPKSEQTVFCEMEPAQRKLYNELRRHYRDSLLKRIETEGMAKSKIQVLEALLRLRQAACHPGLLDASRTGDPSAKLEMLLEQLTEVLAEGHKALVFSQFTSLLSIVRSRLDASGIAYEYLDGQTRDRQQRVERFQNNKDCKLFLISLKAGGLGLNLTAAEYVFLLDPWWNPAVEAQAVDRAHRIGQSRQVFAYRLIARDTIEEKVLQLQETKRDLAAAIIGADNSLIRNLKREDLEVLLS